jgi:LysR family hydrogen peroxide-inducible transcriptional activator
MQPVYDEPFMVAVPRGHAWAKANRGSGKRPGVASADLKKETMLLLGAGHCFRDQVLGVCPELMRFSSEAEGIQKTFEGSSLETIRQMVASGVGITVLPKTSVPEKTPANSLIEYLPFRDPAPDRRVVLVWRKSFTRTPAIEVLRRAILKCPLPGSTKLDLPAEPA